MTSQRGFIALYALLTLVFLTAVTVLCLARWEGVVRQFRYSGARAQAQRASFAFVQQKLAEDALRTPRFWVAPLQGVADQDGMRLTWSRQPADARWRIGARPWSPEVVQRLLRLGASPEKTEAWRQWLELRLQGRDPALGIQGDLITDRRFLEVLFRDLGLEERWGQAHRMWTIEEGGSINRLNLAGADPEVIEALSGVAAERVRAFQSHLAEGTPDPAMAQAFWAFDEWQSLEPWAALRPFSETSWVIEVRVPSQKEPVVCRWRSTLDEVAPGNPWFKVTPWNGDLR